MAKPEKKTTQEYIIDRLQDIQRKVEANSYTDALVIIKEIRAADVKNIYLVAIEKQIAKLTDTSLPQENRTAIVKSLPSMINRTVSDIQRKAPQQPKPPVAEESQKGQKEAALEKLKKQYFQRADEYVEKKEYQHALEEIRRIYIIEPGSVVAKEYEQKIEQLAALQVRGEAQAASTEEEIKVTKAAPVVEQPKEKVILEEEPKKSKLPIIIGAAAAIVILSVGAWLFLSKGSDNKPAEQSQGSTQQPSLAQESATTTPPVTATSKPPAGKASPSTTVTPKKTNTETKPAAPEKKPVQTVAPAPVTTQPVRTQQQPVQQSPQTTQPAVNTQQPAQQQANPVESTPAPMPFVAIEAQPEIIHRELPIYPDIAIKMGIQGRVTMEVTVDAQGKPIQAKVAKSSSEVFNDAAIQAVMKYTFKPAMMSTGPITAKVYIPIDFRMKR